MGPDDRAELLPSSLVGAVLGRYVLERLLGEGGMGVVYAARHQDLGKSAAVKVLHPLFDRSEERRARFLREGQAASRIRHPNSVDVYDVGTEGGRAYLVMELLEGQTLAQLLALEGPLSAQHAADLLVPVISALVAAHELGIVHRDLKPDNVFLSNQRTGLTPKVLDFGISKLSGAEEGASLTGTGNLLGTPHYMSPEQAQSAKNIDSRTDQYSVGVMLYECVTGKKPVEETALYQLIRRIVQGDFSAPRQHNPELAAAFEQLVLKAMAREPAERFSTMRELGRSLLAFASERVRANHAEALAPDELSTAPTLAAPGAPGVASFGTTLEEPELERHAASKSKARRAGPLLRLGAVMAAGLAAALVWWASKPGRQLDPNTANSTLPLAAAAAPSASVSTASLPHPHPSPAGPSLGQPPPSVSNVPAPSPPEVKAKGTAVKRAPRPAARPELAPR